MLIRCVRVLVVGLALASCERESPVEPAAPPAATSGPAITKILESRGEVHIGGRFGTTGAVVVDGDWLETVGSDSQAVTHARSVMTMQVFPDTLVNIWSPGDKPWIRVVKGRVLAYVHPGVEANFFGRGVTATTDGTAASIVYVDAELLDPYVSWYEGAGRISNGAITQPTGTGYAAALTYEASYGRFFPARRDFYSPADAERVRRIAHENAVR